MKHTLKTLLLAALLAASATTQATTKELAEKYLRSTQVPEMLQAQVDGYADQYTKGQDPASRKRIHEFLQRTMGWDALKDEYIDLVQTTYTEQELNALLRFINTPAGRSMQAKSTTFASKLATLSAKRVQDFSAEKSAAGDDSQDNADIKANELIVVKVEKFQNGDQVYFTGEIQNNSKKVARGVNVEANLFLGDRFVDQYTTYISGGIAPGASRLFKISCGCKGSPPAEHDSYKFQVIAGY